MRGCAVKVQCSINGTHAGVWMDVAFDNYITQIIFGSLISHSPHSHSLISHSQVAMPNARLAYDLISHSLTLSLSHSLTLSLSSGHVDCMLGRRSILAQSINHSIYLFISPSERPYLGHNSDVNWCSLQIRPSAEGEFIWINGVGMSNVRTDLNTKCDICWMCGTLGSHCGWVLWSELSGEKWWGMVRNGEEGKREIFEILATWNIFFINDETEKK